MNIKWTRFIKMVRDYLAYLRDNTVMGKYNAFHGTPGVLADEVKKLMPEVQYATNYAWNELSDFSKQITRY